MVMSTILGSVLGFAGSALGPLVGIWETKETNKLEVKKLEQAAVLAKEGFSQEQIMYTLTSRDDEHKRLLEHDIEIGKGTGWVSATQRLVRPIITYAFFGLFATVEVSILLAALDSGQDFVTAIQYIWREDTQAMFATIISFWFGNRVFEKRKNINSA